MSEYHQVHPVTGAEFDYEHLCATCAMFVKRTTTRSKVKTTTYSCSAAPRGTFPADQSIEAFPACAQHRRT